MTSSNHKIAQSLLALDSEWFTRALRRGQHTEAAVSQVQMIALDFTGAMADMARVQLEYTGSGRTGPSSLIAKIRGSTEQRKAMDAALGAYHREACFYAQLAPDISVKTPKCYFVGDGTKTPLLLEDLGSLRAGNQVEGLTLAEAETLIDTLGRMHAHFWQSLFLETEWLASPAGDPYAEMVAQVVNSGIENLCQQYRDRVDAPTLDAVSRLAPRWKDVLIRGTEGPQTLVHNDCRLDNLFFTGHGEPVFVDWQVVARTRGTQDIGNLLAGSMEFTDLQRHWKTLLQRYHDQLCVNGVLDYDWETCVEHYRQSILYPLGAGIALMGKLDIGDTRGVTDVMVLRPLLHCAELDSFTTI